MTFWNKVKSGIQKFMIGRNGPDQLSTAMLVLSIALLLVASFTGSIVLDLLSLIGYALTIFRMFSRNISKRYEENQKYIAVKGKVKLSLSQAKVRLKNSKKYKYFRCPECKSLIRLPRNVGEVTVTCGKCRHSFKKKA